MRKGFLGGWMVGPQDFSISILDMGLGPDRDWFWDFGIGLGLDNI